MTTQSLPTRYTPELAAEICERLAAGESLRAICRDAHMPSEAAVRQWVIHDRDGFASQYAQARDIGLDVLAEEILEISDDGRNDWVAREDPDNPGYELNGEHIQRSRLRFDARRWYLSKLAPKRYGENSRVDIGNADNKPFEITDAQAAAKLASIIAAGQARKAAEGDVEDLL